jgi:hypothetical protein
VNTATIVAIITALGTVLGVVFTRTRGSKRLDALERLDTLSKDIKSRDEDSGDTYRHIHKLEQVLSRQLLEYYDFAPWRIWMYVTITTAVLGTSFLVLSQLPASMVVFGVKNATTHAAEITFGLAWASVIAFLVTLALVIITLCARFLPPQDYRHSS